MRIGCSSGLAALVFCTGAAWADPAATSAAKQDDCDLKGASHFEMSMNQTRRLEKNYVATFANHYNSRIHRCLSLQIKIQYEIVNGEPTGTPAFTLVDVDQSSVYAVYSPRTKTCQIQNAECRSKEEWESTVQALMTD